MCIFIHYACLSHRHQRRLIQSIEFVASGNLPVILILLFLCAPLFPAFLHCQLDGDGAIEGNRERINTLLCILLMTVNLL